MEVEMRIIFFTLIGVCFWAICVGAPTRSAKDVMLFPPGLHLPPYPQYGALPYQQIRGPFDFIGNWIQSSEWFPIEVNVPDTFANIGNGIGSFATNVGNGFNTFTQNLGMGFQTFTQNVGSNVQNFAQNLGQRFPVFAVLVRPNAPPRYFVLVPSRNNMNSINNSNEKKKGTGLSMQQIDSEVLESFP